MSLSRYRIRPEAQRDLEALAKYLKHEVDDELAMRFLDTARDSFTALGNTPHIGAPVQSKKPGFADLRKWRVAGFSNDLIFYLPLPDGADILRVLHGAQDWWALLDTD